MGKERTVRGMRAIQRGFLYDRTPACTVYVSTAALHPVPGTPRSCKPAQGHESLAPTGRHGESFALLVPPSRAHTSRITRILEEGIGAILRLGGPGGEQPVKCPISRLAVFTVRVGGDRPTVG